jgi:type II secretory pathway pseudopilin PulG
LKTSGRVLILLLAFCFCAVCATPNRARGDSASTATAAAVPPALADLRGFRGRVDYTAYREDESQAPAIEGSLNVDERGWELDERASAYVLHADAAHTSVTSHGDTMAVVDLFEAGALANAWAAALGTLAAHPITATDNPNSWISSEGLRIYLDASGSRLIGIADIAGRNDVGYVFDDWTRSGPITVPQHILRLRRGIPDARYAISHYSVTPAVSVAPLTVRQVLPSMTLGASGRARAIGWSAPGPSAAAMLPFQFAVLACLLLAALFVAGWTRRDALVLTLCRKMARDPRGWRRAGISIFVGPDGVLHFNGLRYRVGPHFYNRAALIQYSALFLRVSAPGVPHVVILARRFRPTELGIRQRPSRRPAPGFTLVETIIATALFSGVILFGIYPALAVLSRADALARERARAVAIASNALEDEEAACAYGVQTGSLTTTVDGLVLTVTVQPGATSFENDLDISVGDNSGKVLAHLASIIGPPVQAPPNSSGGPP